jgi:hypothetical protein
MNCHWTTDKRDTCRMNCNPKYELAAIESVSECSEKGEEVRLPECLFFSVCTAWVYASCGRAAFSIASFSTDLQVFIFI